MLVLTLMSLHSFIFGCTLISLSLRSPHTSRVDFSTLFLSELGYFHTHQLFAGNGSDTSTGLWVFTHTDIARTIGQFVFFTDRREVCPHINRRYLLGVMYLRWRYRKRAIEYWVHPLLTVRYMEGNFSYTLFEKLINHDSKCYNNFRISIPTFDFLVDRVTHSVLLFFLILVKKLFFQKYINFSPSLLFFYFVFKTIISFVP